MEKATPEILRELRKKKGMTQSDIAQILGFSTTAYQNYERGINEPSNKSLCILADFYGVTTDYLLGREPAPQPDSQLYQETLLKLLELNKADKIPFVDKYNALPKIQREALDFIAQCLLEKQNSETSAELIPERNISEKTTTGKYRKRHSLDDEAEAKDGAI